MRFTEALRNSPLNVPIIPDFKMISPSDGPLFAGRDPVQAAAAMEYAGAPALSVVTEKTDFGGSADLLTQIAATVSIPILRKDFIKTKADIEDSIRMGASAVLLICSTMTEENLRELHHTSLEMGIEPLVETHSEEELKLAASLGAKLIGINNRDILALEKDGGTVSTTARLAALKPKGSLLVSESGIQTPADVRSAIKSGADAVLIGTAVWKADDPIAYYSKLAETKV